MQLRRLTTLGVLRSLASWNLPSAMAMSRLPMSQYSLISQVSCVGPLHVSSCAHVTCRQVCPRQ